MKTSQKIFFYIATFMIMNVQIKAQEYRIDFDSLITGKNYKILIDNGWETEGKLIKIDSSSIEIKTEYKIFTIQKSEIKEIESHSDQDPDRFNYESKFRNDKLYLSLGSGIVFTPWFGTNYKGGINLQFNVMKIMSTTHAIRGDIQFTNNPRANTGYYGKIEGGDLNSYSAKFDFLLGGFKPFSKVNGYAILGGGLSIFKETETRNTYPEYNYTTMEYTGRTFSETHKGETHSYINLEAGGGLRYKISDRVRLYGEAQYSFPFIYFGKNGGGASLYGIFFGNPSLKIGAQIEL